MRRCIAALMLVMCLALTGCGNAGHNYTDYVRAVMDCTYYDDTAAYMTFTGTTAETAQAVYADETAVFSAQLRYHATVKDEYIDEETAQGFDALAQELMRKVRYRIDPAVRAGDSYRITITAEPLDFWALVLPELRKAYSKDFSERFYKAQEGSAAQAALEAEWGARALEVLRSHTEEVGYLEPQSTTVDITVDADGHYVVAERDWAKIDALMMDLSAAK